MRVRIDLPVFASPTRAFGYASGHVNVESLPVPQQPFPWPMQWVEIKPEFFAGAQCTVWSVDESKGETFVAMYGIVCESLEQARECAQFLEAKVGLEFDEYGQLEGSSK